MWKRFHLSRILLVWLGLSLSISLFLTGQNLLDQLGKLQNYQSGRVSSFDRSGGNQDRLTIPVGETVVLAEIPGPAAIHHIWITVAAEPFYGRKLILRMYWDNEPSPSVEVPLGDFFGVGHGLNRNLYSLPLACSSNGRARNCYWYMPFRRSARITVTNEGHSPVGAFYYYIDYRRLAELPPETPYFHAQYRQEFPCEPGKNYLILEAKGRGHYVGCNLSILQQSIGWWGEGDDMIYVDGEEFPSLHGTGSEDYFSDAWGMREDAHLFYGCPLQEDDFQVGSKATVYRFHLPDPIPFSRSIKVTIEHGHQNNRSDYFSSVAYWYQLEPHQPFPPLPGVRERLPYACEEAASWSLPEWQEEARPESSRQSWSDPELNWRISAKRLVVSRLKEYAPSGTRLPLVKTDGAQPGDEIAFTFTVPTSESYELKIFHLQGPNMGDYEVFLSDDRSSSGAPLTTIKGYREKEKISQKVISSLLLEEGPNTILFRRIKEKTISPGEFGFITCEIKPDQPRFIDRWLLIGPFEAPDMSYLEKPYPPEKEIDLKKTYQGKNQQSLTWQVIKASPSGYVRLDNLLKPSSRGIAYALVYLYSPENFPTKLLVGSDDGLRVWLNDQLLHTNPAYRAAAPDQDSLAVVLKKGWNKLLLKILQGEGGWGFYARFVDPKKKLKFSGRPPSK